MLATGHAFLVRKLLRPDRTQAGAPFVTTPEAEFEFFLAEKQSMTVEEMRHRMSNDEFLR